MRSRSRSDSATCTSTRSLSTSVLRFEQQQGAAGVLGALGVEVALQHDQEAAVIRQAGELVELGEAALLEISVALHGDVGQAHDACAVGEAGGRHAQPAGAVAAGQHADVRQAQRGRAEADEGRRRHPQQPSRRGVACRDALVGADDDQPILQRLDGE